MIQNITGVVFIIFHIICCVLVWTGINSHLLKVKRYLILPVIFVPVWGMICVLLLHFQIFFHQTYSQPETLLAVTTHEDQ